MKASKQLLYYFLNIIFIISFSEVAKAENLTCQPYKGIEFPEPGIVLTYEQSGHNLVQHRFVDIIEGDKIVLETSIPSDSNNNPKTYTQHIHRVSRQIVWTSEPITSRQIPGVLPQSDYTDLWIPIGTQVGSRLNIASSTLLAGSSDETKIYVGEVSDKTKQDARMYARSLAAGVFEGFNTHAPSPKLKSIEKCTSSPITTEKISATTITPENFYANSESTIKVLITNNSESIFEPIIDLEIFDQSGNKISQNFTKLDQEEIASGSSRQVEFKWTPKTPGNFIGKLGIFTANWQNLLYWNNSFIPNITVSEKTSDANITLSDAFITSTPYYLSQRAILHAQFKTPRPPSNPTLIDLELYNSNNEKVAQTWFDNIKIENSEILDKSLDVPQYLPAGEYLFKVGIFNPGWNGLINWYNEVLKFPLHDLGQWEDEIVILSSISPKTNQINIGEKNNFIISLNSPNTQNHVNLDLILKNNTGAVVIEKKYENIGLPRSGTGNYENIYTLQTPTDLPIGTYSLDITIRKTDNSKIIQSYETAATLDVVGE